MLRAEAELLAEGHFPSRPSPPPADARDAYDTFHARGSGRPNSTHTPVRVAPADSTTRTLIPARRETAWAPAGRAISPYPAATTAGAGRPVHGAGHSAVAA